MIPSISTSASTRRTSPTLALSARTLRVDDALRLPSPGCAPGVAAVPADTGQFDVETVRHAPVKLQAASQFAKWDSLRAPRTVTRHALARRRATTSNVEHRPAAKTSSGGDLSLSGSGPEVAPASPVSPPEALQPAEAHEGGRRADPDPVHLRRRWSAVVLVAVIVAAGAGVGGGVGTAAIDPRPRHHDGQLLAQHERLPAHERRESGARQGPALGGGDPGRQEPTAPLEPRAATSSLEEGAG